MNLSRILIVGYTKKREALESSYAHSFQQLGYEVIRWDPLEVIDKLARLSRFGQILARFIHVEPWVRKANQELLLLVDKTLPQLIIIIGTSGIRAGTLAQLKVRHPQCTIYCVYPDSPHNLDQERIGCFPFFDRLTTSSPAWVNSFKKLGACNTYHLPFAADLKLHKPTLPNQSSLFQSDIAFIGTWRPEREEFLEKLTDFDLKIWGNSYWKKRTRKGSPIHAKWGGRAVVGDEFSQVCANSKIMLNIMDVVTWPGPNMRTFEQPACRGFSLTTRSSAILEVFEEDKTIACFDTLEEAQSKIEYYLNHDDERNKIAETSYRFVIEHGHTYLDRARQIVTWFKEDSHK